MGIEHARKTKAKPKQRSQQGHTMLPIFCAKCGAWPAPILRDGQQFCSAAHAGFTYP